jgi:hypothetical protein
MNSLIARFRRAYGAHPAHLLTLLLCFALTGYVVQQLSGNPSLPRMLVWFAGAVVAHDLVAFPLYALADRAARSGMDRVTRAARVPPLNYVRVPALGSGLLFITYLPGIVRQGAATFHAATGRTQEPFLLRWLILTAGMFAISAAVYSIRRIRRPRPPAQLASDAHEPG